MLWIFGSISDLLWSRRLHWHLWATLVAWVSAWLGLLLRVLHVLAQPAPPSLPVLTAGERVLAKDRLDGWLGRSEHIRC